MKILKRNFVGLMIFVFLFPSLSMAKDTITWLVFVWPPVHIVKGEKKGEGMMDGVMKILQKNMTDYEHKTLQANIPRVFQKMKAKENVCYVTSLKTPDKEEFMHFSIPDSIFLSNSVVVRKNDPRFSIQTGTISLTALAGNSKLKGGINKARKYGPGIDKILSDPQHKKNFFYLADSSATSLSKMLEVKRIDYMIAYPWTIGYLEKQKGTNALLTLSIEETPDYNLGYASCAKTPWGKKVVESINETLIKVRPTEEFRHYMVGEWYDDNGYKRIQSLYDSVFINSK